MTLFDPCNALQPYISHFMVSETETAQSYTVLPGTSLVMGFQYAGRLAYQQQNSYINMATSGVTGILGSHRIFQNTANTGTVLAIFKEAGAAHFFKEPLNELYNESLALDNLVDRGQLAVLQEQLSAARNSEERINLVERFLLSRLYPLKTDLLVNAAIRQIHRSGGHIRITDLAAQLNTSKSPLEKRFRQTVGTTAKKFAGIVRMKSALITMQSPLLEQNDHLLGYYDQAHFIHDFKKFTGTTPEQYLRELTNQK